MMGPKQIVIGLILASSGLCVLAQSPMKLQRKCDGIVRRQIAEGQKLTSIIIKCNNSSAVADVINADGYHATAITSTILTARVPADYIAHLSENAHIQYIQSPRQVYSTMTEARQATGADKVQSGDGLYTPYTGKGVIIGVIDQGFEFRHIAFLDSLNHPRVLAVWNRKGYSTGTDSEPTTNIPSNGDGINVEGHATHVTNIAAGSKIAENNYYGIAPGADIIMVPSEFSEAEIIEDVKYIRDFAAAKGEPWVVNMSFGAQIGSHDGKNYFSQAVDEILAEKPGRQIVVAAGNDGYNIEHASGTLKSDRDTLRMLVGAGAYGIFADIWSQTTDSLHHINVRPFLYNSGERDYRDSTYWASNYFTHQIAPYNGKENYDVSISAMELQGSYLGLEITGDKGTVVHAWTTYNHGDFVDGPDSSYVKGDKTYCINDVGACADNTVTVAAYVTSNSYPTPNGTEDASGAGDIGDIANFSSTGPSLSQTPKPTVTAPGSMIKSAVSKYGVGFDKSGSTIVQDVRRGIKHFYYGAMAGTSMATPVVTGIIALWLEANPNLSYSQILDIIKSTSVKDQFTGSEEWNKMWGYGKIDAYNGLKEALRLADKTGVASEFNTQQPVTIQKVGRSINILFNSDERFADIQLTSLNGSQVVLQRFNHLQRGDEKVLTLNGLTRGVYILRVSTENSRIVRKFIITD